jgi:hypothetical protein
MTISNSWHLVYDPGHTASTEIAHVFTTSRTEYTNATAFTVNARDLLVRDLGVPHDLSNYESYLRSRPIDLLGKTSPKKKGLVPNTL